MPPKNQPKKKISFENDIIDPKLKQILTSSNKKINKKRGGAKLNSDDSDDMTESESSDSDSEVEETFDEIDEDDALENENDIEDEDIKSVSENDDDDDDQGNDNINDDGDECMYRFSGKKSSIENGEDGDDEIDDGEFYFEEDEKLLQNIFVPNDKRITRPVLTKYERVRVLGERTKQLSLNAKPMVKGAEKLNPKEIAKLELKMGVLPMIIIRPLPTGQKERWKVSELKIVN